MKTKSFQKRVIAILSALCMVFTLAPVTAFADSDTVINEAIVYYEINELKTGEAPKSTNPQIYEDGYAVEYEFLQELKENEDGTQSVVAYWYSDESRYGAGDAKITTLEYGKQYNYGLVLKAADGYAFAEMSEFSFYNDGKRMWDTSSLTLSADRKYITVNPLAALKMTTLTDLNLFAFKLYYKAGEEPRETADIDPSLDKDFYGYEVYDEYWEEMESDGNGGVVPVKFWHSNFSELYNVPEDKRITTFEAGKTYMYSLQLKAINGRAFSNDCTVVLNEERISQNLIQVNRLDTRSMFIPAIKTIKPSADEIKTIDTVDINAKTDYTYGENPVASATLSEEDSKKITIAYECWKTYTYDESASLTKEAYWYSKEKYYMPNDLRFSEFEKGKDYTYKIYLKAKDGYLFAGRVNITINGEKLPFGGYANSTYNGQGCVISGMGVHPADPVEKIYIEDATIKFKAGDKPVFTAKTGENQPYFIDHERWDTDGKGITSSEYWNDRLDGNLIDTFESGKTYSYGIYIKLTEEGYKQGWKFDENTKLSINGQDIDLNDDYVNLSLDTIWISNVFTFTPTATGDPKLGDVNADGIIDSRDAIEILRYDAKVVTFDDAKYKRANVNYDNTVNSSDAVLILQYDAKIIDKFSPNRPM